MRKDSGTPNCSTGLQQRRISRRLQSSDAQLYHIACKKDYTAQNAQFSVTMKARMPCVTKMSLQLRWPRPPPPLLASAPGTDDGVLAAHVTATAMAVVDSAVTAAGVAVADAAMCHLSRLPLPPLIRALRAPREAAVASETACCKQHVTVHDAVGKLYVTTEAYTRGSTDTAAK